jgi:hypothetical protein
LKFEIKIINEPDEDKWNNLLTSSNASTAYQTVNWIRNYQNIPNSKPIFIQIEKNGVVVGQLASIIHQNYLRNENKLAKNIGWKFNISSLLTWVYGPIIFDQENHSEILSLMISKIEEIAKQNKIVMIRGSTPPLDKNNFQKIFDEHNFDYQPWSTYILKLNQNKNSFYDSFNKKTRYDIRKSETNNLTFETPNDENYLQEFYDLKNEEYERDGRKVVPTNISYKKRWTNLCKNGLEKVFLAKHDGIVISGISNIIFNGYMLQHAVANSHEKNLLGGTYVTWKTIEWAINNNQRYYDMGGINPSPISKKEKNIDFFKSKWGGEEFSFGIFVKILNKKKQLLSSALRNPNKILKKIG